MGFGWKHIFGFELRSVTCHFGKKSRKFLERTEEKLKNLGIAMTKLVVCFDRTIYNSSKNILDLFLASKLGRCLRKPLLKKHTLMAQLFQRMAKNQGLRHSKSTILFIYHLNSTIDHAVCEKFRNNC